MKEVAAEMWNASSVYKLPSSVGNIWMQKKNNETAAVEHVLFIPDICHFFYTCSIVKFQILHPKID